MQHTPGPWKVNDNPTGQNDDGSILVPNGKPIVSDVYAASDREDVNEFDEAEADTHLIAAAPELLDALENLRDYIANVLPGDPGAESMLQLAQLAIAKARPVAVKSRFWTKTANK